MYNLFRMHIYRTLKSKSTLVLGILLVVFTFLHLGLGYIVFEDPLNIQAGGLYIQSNGSDISLTPDLVHQFFIQGNSALLILLTIFTVLMTNSDITKGFVKNIYGMFEDKGKLVLAKWCAVMSSVTLVYLVTSIVSLGLAILCYRTSYESGNWDLYLIEFVVVYIGCIAMMTMVFLITSLFKSSAGGMVIGLVIASGILQSIERLIDVIIAKLSGATGKETIMAFTGLAEEGARKFFRISDYCIDNVFISFSPAMEQSDIARTVIVSAAYALIGLGLAVLLAKKRDVKI